MKRILIPIVLLTIAALACGVSSPNPTHAPPEPLTGTQVTVVSIILIVTWLVLFFSIAIEAYNGLVQEDVKYPLGYLIGGALGLGLALLLGLGSDGINTLAILGWYIGSNFVQLRATGSFAKVIGLFWVLVLIGLIYGTWRLLS